MEIVCVFKVDPVNNQLIGLPEHRNILEISCKLYINKFTGSLTSCKYHVIT